MVKRFVDRSDIKQLLRSATDFRVRKHRSFVLWTTYAFIAAVLLIILIAKMVLDSTLLLSDHEVIPFVQIMAGAIAIVLIMMVLQGGVFVVIRRLSHIAIATEFHNLLLSVALRKTSRFFVIVSPDKTIVYHDGNAEEIFSKNALEKLDDMLSYETITPKNREALLQAVGGSETKAFDFYYNDSYGKKHTLSMVVEPFERPEGYVLIFGR